MINNIEEKILDDLYERDYNKGNEIHQINYYKNNKKEKITLEEWSNSLLNLKNLEYITFDTKNDSMSEEIVFTEKGIKHVINNRIMKRRMMRKNAINKVKRILNLK